jgi:hypothetical protein
VLFPTRYSALLCLEYSFRYECWRISISCPACFPLVVHSFRSTGAIEPLIVALTRWIRAVSNKVWRFIVY